MDALRHTMTTEPNNCYTLKWITCSVLYGLREIRQFPINLSLFWACSVICSSLILLLYYIFSYFIIHAPGSTAISEHCRLMFMTNSVFWSCDKSMISTKYRILITPYYKRINLASLNSLQHCYKFTSVHICIHSRGIMLSYIKVHN